MFEGPWDTSIEQSLKSLEYGPSVKDQRVDSGLSLVQVDQRVAIIAAPGAISRLSVLLNLEYRISSAPGRFILRPQPSYFLQLQQRIRPKVGSYYAERVLFLYAAEEAVREAVVWGLGVSRETSPAMEGMMNFFCPPEQTYKELNAICF